MGWINERYLRGAGALGLFKAQEAGAEVQGINVTTVGGKAEWRNVRICRASRSGGEKRDVVA